MSLLMKILLKNKPERASNKVPDVSDLLKGLFYTHMQNLLKAIHSPQHNTSLELQSLAMEPSCIPRPQVGTRAILQWILYGITILKLVRSENEEDKVVSAQHHLSEKPFSKLFSSMHWCHIKTGNSKRSLQTFFFSPIAIPTASSNDIKWLFMVYK